MSGVIKPAQQRPERRLRPLDGAAGPSVDWETLTYTLRPENSPGFLLWQVANHWQRLQRQSLEVVGITHVQFILLAGLAFLEAKDRVVTQARLAQFCRTDAMMTSQVVRSLEQTGLLARAHHPEDKRAKRLALTEKGAEVLNRAMPAVLDADLDFFCRLGDAKPDLVEALRKLVATHSG